MAQTMTTDNCGWPTADDTACQHPATDADTGRCWLHADDAEDVGRPTKFNDDRAQEALAAARQSKSKAGCARAAGVTHPTLLRWVEQNPTFTDSDGVEREFSTAFAQARRDGETVLVQGGLRNDEVDTSMAKFLLATSFGYIKTERKEVTGDGGGPLEIVLNEEVVTTPYADE